MNETAHDEALGSLREAIEESCTSQKKSAKVRNSGTLSLSFKFELVSAWSRSSSVIGKVCYNEWQQGHFSSSLDGAGNHSLLFGGVPGLPT